MMAIEQTRIFDIGARGRVLLMHINQERQILGFNPEINADLSKIEQIRISNQRLSLSDNLTNNRLQKLLSDVLNAGPDSSHQVGGYIKIHSGRDGAVLISVFPVSAAESSLSDEVKTVAEIRISYPKKTNLDVFSQAMRELYQLSHSESKVVSLLVQGFSTKEIASNLHVADSTLRTHLKRIFSKTETRHQAELVSRILLYDTEVMPEIFA